ncbi:helix-turn-helix transcriptional regulator [Streptomyces triculaminicus]|uniref:Helix-turn-helix transcriptional regulator n=1 Tax=Streptomyces triculaminicus TaxID=2816232 RepID=A0A939FU03_9ACTN|nr:helix-turn-helix transcriptional regulator [Streptomyces triculaminicus]MBO0656794.1 helix-turn-helix transcriptional regulator [Streptomyces triculaminicus]
MIPEGRRAFGARVAELRAERGLTQRELAAEIGRTTSWLSQVERGVQPVNRLDVLRLLADALGVALHALRPDAPRPVEPAEAAPEPNDLDQVRLLLSGHPALEVVLDPRTWNTRPSLADLRRAVDHAWSLAHGDRFSELTASLSSLIPTLERVVRTVGERERPEAYSLLARTYQAMSAVFARQNEADAAWVAADRSIAAAELSGRLPDVIAGTFRLAHACVRLKRYDQAEHVAQSAVNALGRHMDHVGVSPEMLSLLGSLHLALALVHARCRSRAEARREMELARHVAAQLGEDRNDFNLEFGPTNVEIQAVSVAVDLGDAGEALHVGGQVDASGLSVERRARLALDLGRAHAQLRNVESALRCFTEAETLAPEMVRSHTAARAAVRDLMLVAGRSASPELRALAQRTDAMS